MGQPGGSIARLCDAVRKARLTLRRFRQEHVSIVREYLGAHWSEEGARLPVPLNTIAMYCNIVGRALISKNPRVMLSTFDRSQKATVAAEQLWVNREIEKIDFAGTEQRAVLDGLIGGPGIVKVALATPSDTAVAAWDLPTGNPFADTVDLDDFAFDIHARDFREVGWIGHRYRVPIDTVRDSRLYTAERKNLVPQPDEFFNAEGDERVSVLGREYYSNQEEFEDMVDLWEFWIPRQNLILTLADMDLTGPGGKVLREQEWVGPDTGPYHLLSYMAVPGNAMPKSPVQDLFDLHLAINNMLRKLIRQAQNLKQNIFVAGGADEDGSRVLRANDGDIIKVDNPQNITSPGSVLAPNQQLFALLMQFKEFFNYAAGNMDMMGGLAHESPTATQDELLAKGAGGQIQDMQETTLKHTTSVCKALLWYWHKHPKLRMQIHEQIPGTTLHLKREATPKQRAEIDVTDMQIQVDPYSLQAKTPQTVMQELDQMVTQVLIPLMPLLQPQGVAFDANAYLKIKAQLMNNPQIEEIVTLMQAPDQSGAGAPQGPPGQGMSQPGGGSMPKMAPQTTRTYERVSRPGRSQKGNAMDVANKLMGAPAGGNPNGAMR
jgi:hypothetical protein